MLRVNLAHFLDVYNPNLSLNHLRREHNWCLSCCFWYIMGYVYSDKFSFEQPGPVVSIWRDGHFWSFSLWKVGSLCIICKTTCKWVDTSPLRAGINVSGIWFQILLSCLQVTAIWQIHTEGITGHQIRIFLSRGNNSSSIMFLVQNPRIPPMDIWVVGNFVMFLEGSENANHLEHMRKF
jgi:hypothetical protein